MHFSVILSLAGCFAVANGHFTLNFPATRGFDENLEPNICGGFTTASHRSQFPLNGGIVTITSHHPSADLNILVSFNSNPTTFTQFNTTDSGKSYPFLVNFTHMNVQGDACFPVNIGALGVPQAQNGANATIMVEFNGGDGLLYQCSDLVLSNTFTVPNSTQCTNATGAFTSGVTSASGSPSLLLISTFGIMGLFVLGFY